MEKTRLDKLVRFWQSHKGLKVDGIPGPITEKSIDSVSLDEIRPVQTEPSDVGTFMVECIDENKFKVTVENLL